MIIFLMSLSYAGINIKESIDGMYFLQILKFSKVRQVKMDSKPFSNFSSRVFFQLKFTVRINCFSDVKIHANFWSLASKVFSVTRTIFSHSRSEQFWKQNEIKHNIKIIIDINNISTRCKKKIIFFPIFQFGMIVQQSLFQRP